MPSSVQSFGAAGAREHPPPWIVRAAPLGLRLALPIVLIGAVLTAFEPALEAGFVNWDDDKVLVDNAAYRGFTRQHLRWMFTSHLGGHWQPLTWLSLAVDDAMFRAGWWSLETFVYHLTSVLLHAASTLLFYGIARRLLAQALGSGAPAQPVPDDRPPGEPPGAPVLKMDLLLAAAFAALVFAVHPLRVESVAWVTERRDVLSLLLMLGTTLTYLHYAAARSRPADRLTRQAAAWWVATVVLYALALLAKASAVVLPVLLLILDVYPLGRRGREPWRPSLTRLAIEKTPMWLAALAVAILAWQSQQTGGAYTLQEYPLGLRLAQACQGLVFYAGKTLLPTGLGPLIQIPPSHVLLGPKLALAAGLIAIVGYLVWQSRMRRPWAPAALVAYVVPLLPVLGFFQSGPQLVADRYSYLACLPLALLAGGAVLSLARRIAVSRHPRQLSAVLLVLVAGALTVLHHATSRLAVCWQDSLSLWKRAIDTCPTSSVAHVQYGNVLANLAVGMGDPEALDRAMDHYRYALSLDPADFVAWHYLGCGLLMGSPGEPQLVEAREALHRAIGLNPQRPEAYRDLARACRMLSWHRREEAAALTDEALQTLRRGAAANPQHVPLLAQLAVTLSSDPDPHLRNAGEAVEWARQASRLSQDTDPDTLLVLAEACAQAGQFTEAAAAADRAAELARQHRRLRLQEQAASAADAYREGKTRHVAPP